MLFEIMAESFPIWLKIYKHINPKLKAEAEEHEEYYTKSITIKLLTIIIKRKYFKKPVSALN